LQNSGAKVEQIEAGGFTYAAIPSNIVLKKIVPMKPEALHVSSLQGVVEYLKQSNKAHLIHIPRYNEVQVLSGLNETYQSRFYYVTASVPKNLFIFDRFMSVESFIISVMANFVETPGRQEVLAFVSGMQADDQDKSEDDGISQKVMVKRSVTTVGSAIVPNPVELQPYVTFPEINQPPQMYIFRVKKKRDEPIMCALFEVAARTWEVHTVREIRNYFSVKVPDNIVIS